MRTRTRDHMTLLPSESDNVLEHKHDCSTVTSTKSLNFDYPVGTLETMTDVVIPNFHSRVREGEVFVNPMTKTYSEAKCSMSTMSYRVNKKPGQACAYTQTVNKHPSGLNNRGAPLGHVSVPIDIGRLHTIAGTSATAAIDAATFESFVFAAELRETLEFLRNPLANWNRFLGAVRRSKNKNLYDRGKTVHDFLIDNWLSYRYGIRPLVNDIQNAIQAVKDTGSTRPPRRTARGTASEGDSASETRDVGGGYVHNATTSRQVSVRSGILYQGYRDPNTWGLTLSDVPGAAWEALRLSFIIDWFANIGPWINAITPIAGVKILASWTTTRDERVSSGSVYWSDGGSSVIGPRIITANGATQESLVSRSVTRQPGVSVGLTLKPQPFNGDIGKARLVDIWGIGTGLLKAR